MKKLSKKQLKHMPSMIDKYRDQGMSDLDIYQELRKISDQRWSIFKSINNIAPRNLRQNYKALNVTLVTLLVILGGLKFFGVLALLIEASSPIALALAMAAFASFLPLYFSRLIYNYQGYAYRIVGVLSFLPFLSPKFYHGDIMDICINASFNLAIGGLAFHLGHNMFPNLKIFFVKANKEGEYTDQLSMAMK